MTCHSSICVYNNFPPRQSAISVWPSNHESSRWIDEKLCILIYHIFRNNRIKYIFFNIFVNLFLSHIRIVLCRENYRFQTLWSSILLILHCHLGLSIRTQIRQGPVFAHFGKLSGQLMRHRYRIRHIFFCLIRGIAKHHSLISGADCLNVILRHYMLFCLQRFVYSEGNVRRLLVNRSDDATGIRVKAIFPSRIADFTHCISHNFGNIYIRICCNLSHHHHHTCRTACFACYAAHWILLHQRVQNRI